MMLAVSSASVLCPSRLCRCNLFFTLDLILVKAILADLEQSALLVCGLRSRRVYDVFPRTNPAVTSSKAQTSEHPVKSHFEAIILDYEIEHVAPGVTS
jgi:hypothetical protein